jgi:hypothetical protein
MKTLLSLITASLLMACNIMGTDEKEAAPQLVSQDTTDIVDTTGIVNTAVVDTSSELTESTIIQWVFADTLCQPCDSYAIYRRDAPDKVTDIDETEIIDEIIWHQITINGDSVTYVVETVDYGFETPVHDNVFYLTKENSTEMTQTVRYGYMDNNDIILTHVDRDGLIPEVHTGTLINIDSITSSAFNKTFCKVGSDGCIMDDIRPDFVKYVD